jgi:hypothetical protein
MILFMTILSSETLCLQRIDKTFQLNSTHVNSWGYVEEHTAPFFCVFFLQRIFMHRSGVMPFLLDWSG